MLHAERGHMIPHTHEAAWSNAALALTLLGGQRGDRCGVNNLTDGSLTSAQDRSKHHMRQLGQSSQALTNDSGQFCAQGGQPRPVISPEYTMDIEEELSILQSRVIWTPPQQLPAALVAGPFTPDRSTSSAGCLTGLSAPSAGIMPLQHCAAAASEHEVQPAGAAARAGRSIKSKCAYVRALGRHAAVQGSVSQGLECMTPPGNECGPVSSWQPALQLHSQGGSNLQKPEEMPAPASASLSPSDLPQGVRAARPPSLHSVAGAEPRPGSP